MLGLDGHIFRNVSCRLMRLDYVHMEFVSGQNGVFSTGLVCGFRHR